MEEIRAYLKLAYVVILVSGLIDLSFWFLSGGTYFVPSWAMGLFCLSASIPAIWLLRARK